MLLLLKIKLVTISYNYEHFNKVENKLSKIQVWDTGSKIRDPE
jgi:hypothetical protein